MQYRCSYVVYENFLCDIIIYVDFYKTAWFNYMHTAIKFILLCEQDSEPCI